MALDGLGESLEGEGVTRITLGFWLGRGGQNGLDFSSNPSLFHLVLCVAQVLS